jgi:hypothetical protein
MCGLNRRILSDMAESCPTCLKKTLERRNVLLRAARHAFCSRTDFPAVYALREFIALLDDDHTLDD